MELGSTPWPHIEVQQPDSLGQQPRVSVREVAVRQNWSPGRERLRWILPRRPVPASFGQSRSSRALDPWAGGSGRSMLMRVPEAVVGHCDSWNRLAMDQMVQERESGGLHVREGRGKLRPDVRHVGRGIARPQARHRHGNDGGITSRRMALAETRR